MKLKASCQDRSSMCFGSPQLGHTKKKKKKKKKKKMDETSGC